MCCEPTGKHVPFRTWGADCCCCGPALGHHFRRYPSTRERIERLEAYREELKKELDGVAEAIEEIGSN